jgi:MoxR-like ATPase
VSERLPGIDGDAGAAAGGTDGPADAAAAEASALAARVDAARAQVERVVIGQRDVVDQVLMALLAGGHVLIEGVPGLGKTLLVRALARCAGVGHARIQFTPDLMPSDVTGHAMFDLASGRFEVRRGPAFTNLLLADEINRAPAKTQAALLEVMQEQQITIEGQSFPTGSPFMVLATQNPIEQDGTYPLPEAELDRFLFKVQMGFPEHADEVRMVADVTAGSLADRLDVGRVEPVLDAAAVLGLQACTARVMVDGRVVDYAVRIAAATRGGDAFDRGAGPRGSIALVRAARAAALLDGRAYATPDDVHRVALPVLRHRVRLAADLEIEGTPVDAALARVLDRVAAPRA